MARQQRARKANLVRDLNSQSVIAQLLPPAQNAAPASASHLSPQTHSMLSAKGDPCMSTDLPARRSTPRTIHIRSVETTASGATAPAGAPTPGASSTRTHRIPSLPSSPSFVISRSAGQATVGVLRDQGVADAPSARGADRHEAASHPEKDKRHHHTAEPRLSRADHLCPSCPWARSNGNGLAFVQLALRRLPVLRRPPAPGAGGVEGIEDGPLPTHQLPSASVGLVAFEATIELEDGGSFDA